MKKAIELTTKYPGDLATNLEHKLSSPPRPVISEVFCFWSDLLGFGKQFSEHSWKLSTDSWLTVRDRLLNAHTIALRNSSVVERLLILNDGIAKVYRPFNYEFNNYLLNISIFIRGIVFTHLEINRLEKENSFPGTRSVLTFGESLSYIQPEVKMDDYYLRYTKPDPDGCSEAAKKAGNPTIIYNPKEFQMNTAFSKAFIIESLGSKGGIEGANLYVDGSAVERIKKYAQDLGYDYIWEEEADYVEFLIPRKGSGKNDIVLGFRLSLPFVPAGIKWDTVVYRMLRFYPWDEATDEFWFEL